MRGPREGKVGQRGREEGVGNSLPSFRLPAPPAPRLLALFLLWASTSCLVRFLQRNEKQTQALLEGRGQCGAWQGRR